MGFYLRKSVKVGPLRFNLSGSGIGISGGIRGLRVGTGPRGNYIHMGRGGFYYRATIPSATPPPMLTPRSPEPAASDGLTEIESGAVEAMSESSSEALLAEIRAKRRLVRYWPFWLFCGGLIGLIVLAVTPTWATAVASFVYITGLVWLRRRDALRKTVVLMYDFEPDAQATYEAVHNGFDWLSNSQRVWHMEARRATADWKHNAGAGYLVRRRRIPLRTSDPPGIKTNVAVPAIPVGRQSLYFLPDRILVFDGKAVGAVGYDQLRVDVAAVPFIESDPAPSDAELIEYTWRYVNKRGGPDRRFKDNPQYPVLRYAQVHLTTSTGLNEMLQLSNRAAADNFVAGIRYAAERLASAAECRPDGEPVQAPGEQHTVAVLPSEPS